MMNKPRIAAWGTFYNGTMQDFAYNKEGAERSASLDFHNRNLSIEPLIRLADHEAALAGLRADRDQQYDMKVKAREQRDAVTSARAADKARINELLGLLREARELIGHGDFREGHCMCGGDVSRHIASDNHSPVDAGVYYAGQVMERIDAALSQPKEPDA